jgi:hypothetical protein
MTQPITDTHVDEAASQQGPIPLPEGFTPGPPPAPSPANMPRPQQPQQPQSEPGDDTGDDDSSEGGLKTVEDYAKALKKARKEAADRRVKIRELEPLANKAREIEEGEKTELQKAQERAEAAEKRDRERQENFDRLDIASTLGIERDNIDLIGSGSREQMEAQALKVKALQDARNAHSSPPPSDRPVEGLRPGASPEPPKQADDSYPAAWTPSYLLDRENQNRRTQYGQ